MNKALNGNRHVNTRHRNAWKKATGHAIQIAGLGSVRMERVSMRFTPIYPSFVLTDEDGLAFVEKAVPDMLADMRVIPDDDPAHKGGSARNDVVVDPSLDAPMIVVELFERGPLDGHGARDVCGCEQRHTKRLVDQATRSGRR